MVHVKICGITNVRDARMCVRLGADALGFNLYPRSPRYVKKERVKAIVASLPPFVTPVGLFVDEDSGEVQRTCEFCGLQVAQLHGSESPRYLDSLRHLIRIKAVRLATESDLRRLPRYRAEAYLLDACVPGKLGGTGKTFNWEWAQEARKYGPIILAGGLHPDNVAEAVRVAKPYAVDVATGVEFEPGKKNKILVGEFIRRAKAADITC